MKNKLDHILTSEKQKNITPTQALKRLKVGNERFLTSKMAHRDLLSVASYMAKHGQSPFAVVLNCIDSRSIPEIIFDQGIGDIFTARVAGNVINTDILASMEYATKVAGAKLIVIMGHTHCGAVDAACQGVKMGNITELLEKIQPAVSQVEKNTKLRSCQSLKLLDQIAKQNVLNMIEETLQESPIIQSQVKEKKIIIVGAMHDIATGKVIFFDKDGKTI